MKIILTPRKIAWFFVVVSMAYFICISPKTPVEFFDANMRDEAAIRELNDKKLANSAATARSKKMDELTSCAQRMERIALLYDLTNNPQRVNSAKLSIVEGFYPTD